MSTDVADRKFSTEGLRVEHLTDQTNERLKAEGSKPLDFKAIIDSLECLTSVEAFALVSVAAGLVIAGAAKGVFDEGDGDGMEAAERAYNISANMLDGLQHEISKCTAKALPPEAGMPMALHGLKVSRQGGANLERLIGMMGTPAPGSGNN